MGFISHTNAILGYKRRKQDSTRMRIYKRRILAYGCTDFYFFSGRRWDSIFYTLETLGSMDFDGVKPSKGQDRGRSSFPCPHDRDRGDMKKSVTHLNVYCVL